MKKIILFTTTFVLTAFINVNAQESKSSLSGSKGFIGIYGGYSMLSGNITKHDDYLDLSQGFSKSSGPVFSLDGGYFFNKNIGVGLVFSMSNFSVDGQEVLSAGYVEAFAVDEVTMTVSSYKMLNILPAFYYTLPMDKLNVDFRLMVGYSSLTTPKIQVQLEDAADTPLIQEACTGGGLGIGIGAGLRYSFAKNLGAAIRIDYLYSKPSIDITYQNLNNPTDEFRFITKYNESIGSLNASLGLAYNF